MILILHFLYGYFVRKIILTNRRFVINSSRNHTLTHITSQIYHVIICVYTFTYRYSSALCRKNEKFLKHTRITYIRRILYNVDSATHTQHNTQVYMCFARSLTCSVFGCAHIIRRIWCFGSAHVTYYTLHNITHNILSFTLHVHDETDSYTHTHAVCSVLYVTFYSISI